MEDFIYILIGVIWLVFSVIKGTQKRKTQDQNQQAGSTQQRKERSFDDILTEILGEESEPQTVFQEVSEQESTIEITETEVGGAYQSLEDLYLIEHKEQLKKEGNSKDNSVKRAIEPETIKKIKDHQPFDLRRAIIYQAILERPYA
ncbi:MAG: hypothetical protein RBR84_01180 [Bacteroidales bacterium]|jgi:hypothetical protein|nr:hypothetical protein [Bacteroidales bacterium]MDD4085653.1 hypothetical protein [Bacteroidales bacterium]MDY0084504.1 hypothetical protein [Bacteroidales bacterium]